MSLDEGNSDTLLQEEFFDRRIEKLNHRVTLVSILIPVLIVVILVLAYLDLTKRVISFHDTGTVEVKELSKSLADRFSSLSVKQAKLEAAQETLMADIQKAVQQGAEAVKALDKKTTQSIVHLEKTKPGTEAVDRAVADMGKGFEPIHKQLKSIDQEIKALEAHFKRELTLINGSLADFNELLTDIGKRMDGEAQSVNKIRAEVDRMGAEKLGREQLAAAFEEEKVIYRQMLSLITKNLEGKLDVIREELEGLKEAVRLEAKKRAEAAKAGPTAPTGTAPVANPGAITEQNLQ